MSDDAKGGKSVLNQMAAGIMGEKQAKAARLTPVEGEEAAPPILPNDLPGKFMSNEALYDAARDLRRHAAQMIEVADALDRLVGERTEASSSTPAQRAQQEQHEREVAADAAAAKRAIIEKAAGDDTEDEDPPEKAAATLERAAIETEDGTKEEFDARMERLRAEAQGKTFTGKEAAPGSDGADDGWACPTHGQFKDATSSRGRTYRRCPVAECKEFERLT